MTKHTFLDLSTAHLCPGTRDWLDQQGVIAAAVRVSGDPIPALALASTSFGWFVYAYDEACPDPAALARLLDRRNALNNSFGKGSVRDGRTREAIEHLDGVIAAHFGPADSDMPADLWACMAFARALGCEYILFDADAATLDGLPTFEDAPAPAPSPVQHASVH